MYSHSGIFQLSLLVLYDTLRAAIPKTVPGGTMFCPQCGNEVGEEQAFCQHCGARLVQETGLAETTVSAHETGGRERTAWEDRETKGFFTGLVRTMNDVLLHPADFFKKMPVTGGLTDPLLYALIIGMVGLMFSYFWQILSRDTMQNMMPGLQAGSGQSLLQGTGLALLAFLSPFLIIAGLFLSAGLLHVCLLMLKGAKHGFEATFRTVAYGYSANILMVIPFCGGFLAALWALTLYIIGLREAHETTGGKAAMAVFLPAIACCGIILFALALFLGAAAGSLGMILQQMQN